MFIKNLKKMLTESYTAVSMYGLARVADIRLSWLIYFICYYKRHAGKKPLTALLAEG